MIVNLLKCLLPQSVQNVTMLKVKGDLETSLMKIDIVPKKEARNYYQTDVYI